MVSISFKFLSLVLLAQGVLSIDITVNSWECREKAITIDFDRICSDDNTCTTEQQSNIEGTLSYYGMYDQYGLDEDSVVYLEIDMSLFAPGTNQRQSIFNTTLVDMQAIDICHNTFFNDEGNANNCPRSGDYVFQSSITLPSIAGYKSWAYTGYQGTGELTIYSANDTSSDILGYCTLQLYTNVDRDGGAIQSNLPNGYQALIATLSCIVVMLILGITCLYCSCRNRPKVVEQQLKKLGALKPKLFFNPNSVNGHFKMMEDETQTEARQSWAVESAPAVKSGYICGNHV